VRDALPSLPWSKRLVKYGVLPASAAWMALGDAQRAAVAPHASRAACRMLEGARPGDEGAVSGTRAAVTLLFDVIFGMANTATKYKPGAVYDVPLRPRPGPRHAEEAFAAGAAQALTEAAGKFPAENDVGREILFIIPALVSSCERVKADFAAAGALSRALRTFTDVAKKHTFWSSSAKSGKAALAALQ
jgi:hypothetical protein